jgi:hypothetical protein
MIEIAELVEKIEGFEPESKIFLLKIFDRPKTSGCLGRWVYVKALGPIL